ncbi:MoxR family ATPase [Aureimonas fodinaquatilis]|uniref:MoxR family ATPase n=1 Tax=Aureimonas fodinaquatilis TaxID=2565783 RepID=A0A5B0DSX3_9HYPH|nr:MoxR family ATPase [Aureimonas fodinaquatilis]KAA0969498.1 MoxR family ATPase [Aureimonas fodinaquatilis]
MDGSTSRAPALWEEGSPHELARLAQLLGQRLVGRTELIERLLIGLLTGGHVLIEGPPGLAKTRAVKLLANGLDASQARVQCTPDLMPSDLTGTLVLSPEKGVFDFAPGPLFHQIVLVDEINRAPPKVQSALLEAMAEGQVTVGGVTRRLPWPFMVVATQNSIEHEGTFPLPEAQLDRFLLHVLLELPNALEERQVLDLVEHEETVPDEAGQAEGLPLDVVAHGRDAVRAVYISPALKDFMVRLVMATRGPDPAPDLFELVEHAVSPRGTLSLAAAARARAYLHGRDYATPQDVEELAVDILSHRLILSWRAIADGQTPRRVIASLLERVRPL